MNLFHLDFMLARRVSLVVYHITCRTLTQLVQLIVDHFRLCLPDTIAPVLGVRSSSSSSSLSSTSLLLSSSLGTDDSIRARVSVMNRPVHHHNHHQRHQYHHHHQQQQQSHTIFTAPFINQLQVNSGNSTSGSCLSSSSSSSTLPQQDNNKQHNDNTTKMSNDDDQPSTSRSLSPTITMRLCDTTGPIASSSSSSSLPSTSSSSSSSLSAPEPLASLRNNLTAQNYLRYRRSKRQQQQQQLLSVQQQQQQQLTSTISFGHPAHQQREDSENLALVDGLANFDPAVADIMSLKSSASASTSSSSAPAAAAASATATGVMPHNLSPTDPRIRKIQRNRRRITIYSRYLQYDPSGKTNTGNTTNKTGRTVQERVSRLLSKAVSDEMDEWDSIYRYLDGSNTNASSSSSSASSSSNNSTSSGVSHGGQCSPCIPGSNVAGPQNARVIVDDDVVSSSPLSSTSSLLSRSSLLASRQSLLSSASSSSRAITSMNNRSFKFEPFEFVEVKSFSDLSPKARSGHRIVADAHGNLYSFGGYNKNACANLGPSENSPLFRELWKFDWDKMGWEKLPAHGDEPEKLVSHCMGHFENQLIIYGGTGLPYGENSSNRISMYDIERHQWHLVQPESDPSQLPQEMYGQAMAIDEQRGELYVIGGTNGYYYSLDVHKFNLYTRRWTLLYKHASFETEPGTRYRHEIALYNNKIYVFGGGTNSHCYSLQTLPVFDLATCDWSQQATRPDPTAASVASSSGSSSALAPPGRPQFPQARKCHSLSVINDDCYICGGTSGKEVCPDVWHLNLTTFQWTLIKPRMPYPVYFHSACLDRSGQLTVFGGVDDIQGNSRNNKLCTMWVKVPPLSKIAMVAIRYYFQEGALSRDSLLETGLLEAKEVAKHVRVKCM